MSADELKVLIDRQAITELLYLYCRACDRADEVLLRSLFHPDARHRHGGFDGLSKDFAGFAMRIIGKAVATKHILTNLSIELDGEVAVAESHYSAYHRVINRDSGLGEDHFSGGRYLDRLEKRAGQWKIAARIGLMDYERFEAPTARTVDQLPPTARGRRLGEDALYELLGLERSRRLP